MRLVSTILAAIVVMAVATPTFACEGTVTIGEGPSQIVTPVPNAPIGKQCLNDLLIDTVSEGANYGSHGEFMIDVVELMLPLAEQQQLSWRDAAAILRAALRSEVGNTLRVRVIAFNDFHGNIDGANLTLRSDADGIFHSNTANQRSAVPAGGVDYMAGLVKQLKDGAPNSVVVSAGDLIGASPLNSALFHDEPTIETMNLLGLDFNAVGNHEFDEGRDELLRMQQGGCHPTDPNSCQGEAVGTPAPFEGAKFTFLAANVVDTHSKQTLFPAYDVKDFKAQRVAFIGMTLKGTPSIVTPSGVAGLAFNDEAQTVNDLIASLKKHGVESIVVLVHEGGAPVAGTSINGCTGFSGALVDIVKRLDDAVDLVISGHTHQAYNCMLPNSVGRNIAVTSAGSFSRLITHIDITIDTRTHDVVAVQATNNLVDRNNILGAAVPIQPVQKISKIVAAYNTLVQPIANRVIGTISDTITRTRNAAGESALGDVIADAQLAATAAPEKGGAVVAFMNTGGLRADLTYASSSAGEGDGKVSYGEAFTTQPFGNSLVVKTLTGQQLYDLLNQQWAMGQYPDGGRTLQVSAGFSYQHSFVPNSSPLGGSYVCEGSVQINGIAIDKAASYRVTMNAFLAAGGDNFSVFNLGTDQLGGELDLDAMTAYFAATAPVAPGPQNRIRQVASCN